MSRRDMLLTLGGAVGALAADRIGGGAINWLMRDPTIDELAQRTTIARTKNGMINVKPPRGMTLGKDFFVFSRRSPAEQWEQLDIPADGNWTIPVNILPNGGDLEFSIGMSRDGKITALEHATHSVHGIPPINR